MNHTVKTTSVCALLALACGSVWAVNVLQNPGFETADGSYAAGWTDVRRSWRVATPVRTGVAALQCNGWGEWGESKQTYASAALGGQTVTASVWGLIPAEIGATPTIISSGWNGAVLALHETGFATPLATTNFITADSPTGVWVQGTVVAQLYPDTASIDLVLQAASLPDWTYFQGAVYFDDAVLEAAVGGVPPIPLGISASQGAFDDRVRVNWSASAGATTYTLYRAPVFDYGFATNFATTSALSYDDLDVVLAQTNYYWVKAGNTNGWSNYSDGALGFADTPMPGLRNPGFELCTIGDVPDDWTRIQAAWWINGGLNPLAVRTGTGAAQCNGWGEWGGLRQSFANGSIASNAVYASVWAKIPSTASGNPMVISSGWNGAVLSITPTGSDVPLATTNFITDGSPFDTWIEGGVLAEVPPDVISVDIVLQAASAPDFSYFQGLVYFDDTDIMIVPEGPCALLPLVWAAWRHRRGVRRRADEA